MYIRFFHLVNRNGIQQTSLDPTIDEFYYDGGAHPRTLSLSGVHGKAQISALLQYRCDSGYCGSRCEEHCQEDGDRTDASIHRPTNYTAPDLNSNMQQKSASRVSLSTESIITIAASSAVGILVLVGLIVLLIVNLTIARKQKGNPVTIISLSPLPPLSSLHCSYHSLLFSLCRENRFTGREENLHSKSQYKGKLQHINSHC